METKFFNEICSSIETYVMNSCDKNRSHWYVGITRNPQQRLFSEHQVNQNGLWIYNVTNNTREARLIESTMLDLGYSGGTGGGDEDAIYVYCYLKTKNTAE